MNKHEDYMRKALKLAKKGIGNVNPNPLVGAVIVKNNRIIGTGYHKKYGDIHAEIDALNNCIESPIGGTIYVTLEPCGHYGKTPPCSNALISAGIKMVVIGSFDPNPLTRGVGIELLKRNGIEVITEVLKEKCDLINKIFFHYIEKKVPYIAIKYAMSIDGKVATKTGESKWITNEKSRLDVHKLRSKYMAIMVGINTVLKDNPMLNVRNRVGRDPIRIICDTDLKIPISSNIVNTAKDIKTIVATSSTDQSKKEILNYYGIEIIDIPKRGMYLDLNELLVELGKREIDSILVEGGPTLLASFVENKLFQKMYTYVSSSIIGGINALTPIMGNGIDSLSERVNLRVNKIKKLDNDILIESERV